MLVTLVASSLHLYPFAGRMLIFLVPLVFFVIATAVDQLGNKFGQAAAAVCAVLLLALMVPSDLSRALEPYNRNDMRGALELIAPRLQPGDAIALGPLSGAAFSLYRPGLIPGDVPFYEIRKGADATDVIGPAKDNGYRRVWFVSAHRIQQVDKIIGQLRKVVPTLFHWEGPGTRVLLLDFASGQEPK